MVYMKLKGSVKATIYRSQKAQTDSKTNVPLINVASRSKAAFYKCK
jgi:hypothetical protein